MAWDGWSASGDETRADLGLGASGAGTAAGEGEGEEAFLAKGLFRHRGPVGAGALMAVLICECWGRCDGGYLAASARRMVFRGEKEHVKKRRANAGPEAQLLLCTTVRRPGVEGRRWVQLRGDGGMRGVCLRRAALTQAPSTTHRVATWGTPHAARTSAARARHPPNPPAAAAASPGPTLVPPRAFSFERVFAAPPTASTSTTQHPAPGTQRHRYLTRRGPAAAAALPAAFTWDMCIS